MTETDNLRSWIARAHADMQCAVACYADGGELDATAIKGLRLIRACVDNMLERPRPASPQEGAAEAYKRAVE